jgi:hypothetical protein
LVRPLVTMAAEGGDAPMGAPASRVTVVT